MMEMEDVRAAKVTMTKKAQANVKYVLATHAAERMIPSVEDIVEAARKAWKEVE